MWHIVAYSKESEGHVTPATLFVIVFILVNGFYNYSKFLLEIRLLQSCGKSCLFNFLYQRWTYFRHNLIQNNALIIFTTTNYIYSISWNELYRCLIYITKAINTFQKNGPIMESFLSTNVLIQKHEYKLIGPHQCHEL